eukprot:TRINITY_DN606_c0_g1_i1.p1 TRINITY_DN606_c0_g1~~TRINITY_DN606_c0_g1_i1.p1  ORF type:complete len:116 (-),score=6.62 TRINITY_DN606_c0_g1_i1:477-824(-)
MACTCNFAVVPAPDAGARTVISPINVQFRRDLASVAGSRFPFSRTRKSKFQCTVGVTEELDTAAFRRVMTRKENYNRKGFGLKDKTLEDMNKEYKSEGFSLLLLPSSMDFSTPFL